MLLNSNPSFRSSQVNSDSINSDTNSSNDEVRSEKSEENPPLLDATKVAIKKVFDYVDQKQAVTN